MQLIVLDHDSLSSDTTEDNGTMLTTSDYVLVCSFFTTTIGSYLTTAYDVPLTI